MRVLPQVGACIGRRSCVGRLNPVLRFVLVNISRQFIVYRQFIIINRQHDVARMKKKAAVQRRLRGKEARVETNTCRKRVKALVRQERRGCKRMTWQVSYIDLIEITYSYNVSCASLTRAASDQKLGKVGEYGSHQSTIVGFIHCAFELQ